MNTSPNAPLSEAEKDALVARHGGPAKAREFLVTDMSTPVPSSELQKVFVQMLAAICCSDTSTDPKLWSELNPSWGHSDIVALLAQEKFGGTLIRHSLVGAPVFHHLSSHYTNELPDGTEIDFTAAQFNGALPVDLPWERRERMQLLANPEILRRYTLLRERLRMKLLQASEIKRTLYFPEINLEIGIESGEPRRPV